MVSYGSPWSIRPMTPHPFSATPEAPEADRIDRTMRLCRADGHIVMHHVALQLREAQLKPVLPSGYD